MRAAIPRRIIGPLGPLGFPTSIAIDGKIYIGCQSAAIGDIALQTAAAFEGMIAALDGFDSEMGDLVNLRTYYVYQGTRRQGCDGLLGENDRGTLTVSRRSGFRRLQPSGLSVFRRLHN